MRGDDETNTSMKVGVLIPVQCIVDIESLYDDNGSNLMTLRPHNMYETCVHKTESIESGISEMAFTFNNQPSNGL